jgi:hypothetical protein
MIITQITLFSGDSQPYVLQSELLRVVYSKLLKFVIIYEMAGNIERTGEKRNTQEVLVRKSEGKRPFGRHRRRWEIILEWILGK